MIKNLMESMVDDALLEIEQRYGKVYDCEKCHDDIRAKALNNLKPLYVTSKKGEAYAKLHEFEAQFLIDIVNELTKAIELVSKNPKH